MQITLKGNPINLSPKESNQYSAEPRHAGLRNINSKI